MTVACSGARPRALLPTHPAPAAPAAEASEEPAAREGADPLEGNLAAGEPRPTAGKAIRFDVDALPVATWGGPNKHSGYTMMASETRYRVVIQGPWFAEIVIRQTTSSFDIFTGGMFGSGEPPKCGPRKGGSPSYWTYWTGISARGWTDSGINVEMGRGDFDTATCRAVPAASLSARAAAIVPGFVYGLRVLVPATPLDAGEEQLVLLMPRGALVSAGGDPTAPLRTSNTGAFTRLTLPTDPGTAGTASVRLSPASLGLWTALRKTGRPVWSFQDDFKTENDLLLGVDVVSPAQKGEAREPRTGSLFVSLPPSAYALAYERLLTAVTGAAE
jgi:hypothetical protein